MLFIKHIAGDFEWPLQVCKICGCVLNDYTNIAWPKGDKPPAGFPEGDIYISENANPTYFFTAEPDTTQHQIKTCLQ